MRRARRPLLALIVLVVLLAIGYGLRAAHSRRRSGAADGLEQRIVTTIPPPATRRRGGKLLGHADFRLLWFGQTVSDVGTTVSVVVVPLVAVVYLHASAFDVGVLSALEWLPWLLIGLPAGVWVDRSRRRPLMIGCDLVRTALVASVPVAAAFDALTIAQLLGVAFGTGIATVLFQVAYQSYLPVLIDHADLPEGNAKLQGSQAAAGILGPGLGGLLAQALRAPFALVVDAASYLVSAVALRAIAARGTGPGDERGSQHPARDRRGRAVRRRVTPTCAR